MSQVHLVCRTCALGPLLWSPQPRTQSVWSCALVFDPIMPHTQQLLFSPPKLNTSQGGRWKMSGLGRWWHMHRAERRERKLPGWLWFIQLGRGTLRVGPHASELGGGFRNSERCGGGGGLHRCAGTTVLPAPETSCNSFSETPTHPIYI